MHSFVSHSSDQELHLECWFFFYKNGLNPWTTGELNLSVLGQVFESSQWEDYILFTLTSVQ